VSEVAPGPGVARHDPGSVVRAHLDAFGTGDLDRMLATLAPRAHFASGSTVVDPAEFAEFFGWAIRELAPAMQIENLLVDGERVACQFTESVTRGHAREHLNRAAFYRVEDGLITAATVYDLRD
jgi:hypothetical protein